MQHSNIQKRYFTLVELMVAMGVLVIMMGFLFQFTIGAQRIWNASSKQTTAFSSAQVLMDVLNEDLQNMRYSNEEGETLPFYLHKEKDAHGNLNKVTLAFYADFSPSTGILDTKDESQIGTYPVIYYFEKGDGDAHCKIHRCALDRDTYTLANGSNKTLTNPEQYLWRLCGANFSSGTDYFDQLKNTLLGSTESLKLFDVLADNMQSFDVKVFFGGDSDFDPYAADKSKHYASVKPIAIKIQFELESDNNAKADEETKYSFSKVIFL